MMDITRYNSEAWDREVESGNVWTKPVSPELIRKARAGQWEIFLTPAKSVPHDWFPKLEGLRVLCFASGGGQQGPILAAAGARVTVFDNSRKQLEQDVYVTERDHLDIQTVRGNMTDLAAFSDSSFDLIVHPVSNTFIADILPVWKEAYRVLSPKGTLISGFDNPLLHIFDYGEYEKGILKVSYSIPYSDIKSLPEDELKRQLEAREPLEFGHTLEDQIKGQIDAGFIITGFYEDNSGGKELLDRYINTFVATKAEKVDVNNRL